MDNRQWFREAGFGMMAHWGLYSVLAGEHRGRIARPYAEWIPVRHTHRRIRQAGQRVQPHLL